MIKTHKQIKIPITHSSECKRCYSFQIQPKYVDFQGRVTMAALTEILLTSAGYNAEENGFGIRLLNEIERSWVLLRVAVEMTYFPNQYEKIHVETWIEHVGRASTSRNFRILNDTNEIIGYACSNWAMLDMKMRRAMDLKTLDGIQQYATGEEVLMQTPIKLTPIEGENAQDVFKVKYSDIDINGHVNSLRYIEWIGNCFSLNVYKEKKIKRFEINYVNELLYNEKVSVFVSETEKDDFRFEIRNEDKISCRARVLLAN